MRNPSLRRLSMLWPWLPFACALVATAAPATVRAQLKEFKHPLGYSFSYPASWQIEQTPSGIVILPANATKDAAGNPLEIVIVGGQDAPGVARPDAPDVIGFFEQNFPGMRRTGTAAALRSGIGEGAVLTLEGSTNGIEARQRVYVTLHKGQAIYLVHFGRKDLIDPREADVRNIFVSLSFSQPANDMQLVGTWRREQVESSSGSSGYMGSTTVEILTFAADGTLEHQISTRISGSSSGISVMSGGNPTVSRGRYTAAGGQLIATLDGEQQTFGYSMFMHEGAPALRIDVQGESKPRYYTRVR